MRYIAKVSRATMDATAFIVAVSVLMLLVSYMAAARLYGMSHLIPYSVLLVSCFLLLESLAVGCYSLLSGLGDLMVRKPAKSVLSKPSEPGSEARLTEEEKHQEIYARSVENSLVITEEVRQKRKEAIHDYIYWVMAPLLEQDDMLPLWIEVEDWMNDRHHTPKSRNWKWKQGMNVKYTDISHLIWNIAKRLGMENGYNGNNCASFIVRLFPDLCRNVKDTTIAQNLTANGDKGYIKIDKPEDNDPTIFHYSQTARQEEE